MELNSSSSVSDKGLPDSISISKTSINKHTTDANETQQMSYRHSRSDYPLVKTKTHQHKEAVSTTLELGKKQVLDTQCEGSNPDVHFINEYLNTSWCSFSKPNYGDLLIQHDSQEMAHIFYINDTSSMSTPDKLPLEM